MVNYIQEVSKNVNIQEGEQAIENILLNIYFEEGISNKELSRNNLLPIPVIVAIKKEFIKYGLLIQSGGARLTEEGIYFIENKLGFRGIRKDLYIKLLKETWEEDEVFEMKSILSKIFKERPLVDVTIDQSKCTLDTAIKRAILCLQNYSLVGKDILCVGDDDLVSIAIGFLLKKLFNDIECCNTKIYVMDIDNRILTYIEGIAQKEGLPIKCVRIDLRKPLPKNFVQQFDCLFTDPPYTLEGMKLFLSRGVEALKKQNCLPIFLSYGHKSPDFEFAMQQCFIDMGLIVSKVMARFNIYEGAGVIGNTGQMIILRTTSNSKTLMETFYQGPLYTGELKKTVRSYRCRNCGATTRVGVPEKIKTIEQLKLKGCGKCGNEIFSLIDRNKI